MSDHSDPSNPMSLVFIPALVAILHMLEKRKGALLTETEVLEARDNAVCMAMPASEASLMEEKRGYSDIVAEDAWNEWQRVRTQIGGV